jgi:hypothetical protein
MLAADYAAGGERADQGAMRAEVSMGGVSVRPISRVQTPATSAITLSVSLSDEEEETSCSRWFNNHRSRLPVWSDLNTMIEPGEAGLRTRPANGARSVDDFPPRSCPSQRLNREFPRIRMAGVESVRPGRWDGDPERMRGIQRPAGR